MLGPARRAVNEAARRGSACAPLVWAALLAAAGAGPRTSCRCSTCSATTSLRPRAGAALAAVDIGHGAGRASGGAAAPTRPRRAAPVRPARCGGGARRCWCCRCCCRSPTRCACATAASRRASASSRCCRWRPCSTPRPPACWPALAVAAPRAPGRVRAAGRRRSLWTLLRLYRDPAGVRLRSVRRLLPGADLRRGAAPAPAPAAASGWPTWSGSRPRWRSALAAVGRGLGSAPLAARRRWPRRVPLLAASVALYATGGTLQFRITRADLARGARPDADAPSTSSCTTRAARSRAPTWR